MNNQAMLICLTFSTRPPPPRAGRTGGRAGAGAPLTRAACFGGPASDNFCNSHENCYDPRNMTDRRFLIVLLIAIQLPIWLTFFATFGRPY